MAADVHLGGVDLPWFAHPSSGFGGIGVNIVLGKWGSSEVGSWDPWYEDPGSVEEASDLLNVCDGE